MKSLFLLLVGSILTTSGFAQKAKANVPKPNPTTLTVRYTCPMHHDVVSDTPGKCPKCNMDLSLSKKEEMKKDVTNTYTCPMHTEVVSDHEGVCPKCKSQLVVGRRSSKQGVTEYTCTMHPNEQSSTPGKCPICNKPLVKAKS